MPGACKEEVDAEVPEGQEVGVDNDASSWI